MCALLHKVPDVFERWCIATNDANQSLHTRLIVVSQGFQHLRQQCLVIFPLLLLPPQRQFPATVGGLVDDTFGASDPALVTWNAACALDKTVLASQARSLGAWNSDSGLTATYLGLAVLARDTGSGHLLQGRLAARS